MEATLPNTEGKEKKQSTTSIEQGAGVKKPKPTPRKKPKVLCAVEEVKNSLDLLLNSYHDKSQKEEEWFEDFLSNVVDRTEQNKSDNAENSPSIKQKLQEIDKIKQNQAESILSKLYCLVYHITKLHPQTTTEEFHDTKTTIELKKKCLKCQEELLSLIDAFKSKAQTIKNLQTKVQIDSKDIIITIFDLTNLAEAGIEELQRQLTEQLKEEQQSLLKAQENGAGDGVVDNSDDKNGGVVQPTVQDFQKTSVTNLEDDGKVADSAPDSASVEGLNDAAGDGEASVQQTTAASEENAEAEGAIEKGAEDDAAEVNGDGQQIPGAPASTSVEEPNGGVDNGDGADGDEQKAPGTPVISGDGKVPAASVQQISAASEENAEAEDDQQEALGTTVTEGGENGAEDDSAVDECIAESDDEVNSDKQKAPVTPITAGDGKVAASAAGEEANGAVDNGDGADGDKQEAPVTSVISDDGKVADENSVAGNDHSTRDSAHDIGDTTVITSAEDVIASLNALLGSFETEIKNNEKSEPPITFQWLSSQIEGLSKIEQQLNTLGEIETSKAKKIFSAFFQLAFNLYQFRNSDEELEKSLLEYYKKLASLCNILKVKINNQGIDTETLKIVAPTEHPATFDTVGNLQSFIDVKIKAHEPTQDAQNTEAQSTKGDNTRSNTLLYLSIACTAGSILLVSTIILLNAYKIIELSEKFFEQLQAWDKPQGILVNLAFIGAASLVIAAIVLAVCHRCQKPPTDIQKVGDPQEVKGGENVRKASAG